MGPNGHRAWHVIGFPSGRSAWDLQSFTSRGAVLFVSLHTLPPSGRSNAPGPSLEEAPSQLQSLSLRLRSTWPRVVFTNLRRSTHLRYSKIPPCKLSAIPFFLLVFVRRYHFNFRFLNVCRSKTGRLQNRCSLPCTKNGGTQNYHICTMRHPKLPYFNIFYPKWNALRKSKECSFFGLTLRGVVRLSVLPQGTHRNQRIPGLRVGKGHQWLMARVDELMICKPKDPKDWWLNWWNLRINHD